MSKPRLGAPKRIAVGLLAGSLAVFGVALAPSAGAVEDVTTERLAGATRYGTAAAVAADEAFAAPTRAIVASGENANLADALAASTLAGANAPAPIILTPNATYSPEAKSALAALKGKGVSAVTIVGGTAAVSTAVEDAIKADGFTVTRLAGPNRFATAAAIAQAANASNPADPIGGKKVALIASGFSFADALAGSPAAASGGVPMLLVNADSIPAETSAALDALDINQAVILGGTGPVSESVATQLQSLTGAAPIRLAGENRFATAAAIGEYEIDTLGFSATSAILANGITLVDAVTAGPLGGLLKAPIVLTASLPAESQGFLDAHSDTIAKLYVIGGTTAIDDATVAAAETAAENTDNDPAVAGRSQTSVLSGPELQSARITDFDLDFADLTVEYTYTFDVAVDEDSINEGAFHLYNADTNIIASGTEGEASGTNVAVTFDFTDDGVADGVLAAVETGAVEDEDGDQNPPQSVEVSPLSARPGFLQDIEMTDDEDGIATFVFSSPVYPEALPGYAFVLVDDQGNEYTPNLVETVPDDDDSSTEIEATFEDLDDDDDNTTPDLGDIVRGYIVNNTDGDTPDLVQNVDVSDGGDIENTPDLDGIELPDDNSDLDDDEVMFIFDEDIDSAPDATLFQLYYGTRGSGFVEGTTVVEIDDNEVVVSFSDEAVNEYVAGAWIEPAAVDGVDDDDPIGTNLADGEIVDYAAQRGEVAGPQLDGVEISTETDSFGEFEEVQVIFSFTQELDETDGLTGFSVWTQDGDEAEEISLDECESDNTEVTCSDDDDDSDIPDALIASVDYGSVFTDADNNLDLGTGGPTDFPNPEASFEVEAEAAA